MNPQQEAFVIYLGHYETELGNARASELARAPCDALTINCHYDALLEGLHDIQERACAECSPEEVEILQRTFESRIRGIDRARKRAL